MPSTRPSSRCGDDLAIVTFGFAEAVRIVAGNEIWLANGTGEPGEAVPIPALARTGAVS
ncbi:MAG: hypothetical protein ACM31O_22970 [Bacteroidota bacterium]